MDCAIGMERVLIFRAALSFRHAPRATSLSEGGSIAPRETDPYNYAALCGENFFLTGVQRTPLQARRVVRLIILSDASSTTVAVPRSRCGSVTLAF